MKNRLKDILTTPLIKNSAKISVSNIIMYMLPIIVTPILTRLYTPEAFGEWGVFSSFVTIVNIGLFLGFENVIIQGKEAQLPQILWLCIGVSAITITLIAIIFWGGVRASIPFFTGFPAHGLLIIYLLFYTLYTLLYNIANRRERYYILSFSNVILGSSQALFRIIFAFICLQAINGLILGTTIAQGCAALFIFLFLVRRHSKSLLVRINLYKIKHLFIRYKNFPLYDAPASMLSFAAFNLPVIILAIYFDKADIGCFSIILQLLLMPMSLVGSAMGKVYYQKICANSDNIEGTTHEMLRIITIIAILPLFFIVCGGDKLIIIFLGEQWKSAGDVALCLALWSFPTILTQPLLPLFRAKNKQRTLLVFDFLYFTFGVGSIFLLCQLTKDLHLILLVYTVCCFIVKTALFHSILQICHLSIARYKRCLLLWGFAFIILCFRLTNIFLSQ